MESWGLGTYANLAMSSKKGWRLSSNTDLLVARILKAKYYPLTTVMEVAQRGGRSYIWQSLLASRTVLESGSIRQVGSGEEICIYSHFCLYSHIRVLNEDVGVFNRFFLEVA